MARPPTGRRRRAVGLAGLLGLVVALAAVLPAAGQGPSPSRLTIAASKPVTRRGQITATATLTGVGRPTGTIGFAVFDPADPTCAGPPAATSTRAVAGDGAYVSAPYAAPAAGVYRFVARYGGDAANAAAATSCADPAAAVTVTDPPPPVLGRSFQLGPLSGRIYVAAAPATRARAPAVVPLTESRTLPVGSVVYAAAGVARVTSATATPGRLQAGDFAGGEFKVLQSPSQRGLTELDLAVHGAAAARCAVAARARSAAARPLPRRVLALLRADVAGRFRSRGRFSSATVRGTNWDTVERCDGTLTRVHRGVVVVRDRRRARTVVLRAGQSYLAGAR